MPTSTSQIPFFPSFYWYFTSRSSRFLFFWLVSYPPAFSLPASLGWYLTSQTSPFLPLLTGILPAVSPLFASPNWYRTNHVPLFYFNLLPSNQITTPLN